MSRPVAVVGAGSIGVAWAVVFATVGREVRLFDVDPARLPIALDEVGQRLGHLVDAGLVTERAEVVASRVVVSATLEEAVRDVDHVQECIIEEIEAKRTLFAALDVAAPADAILASSTSTIMASLFADGLAGRERCLVVHPGNPPHFLRIAEIVPAPFTSPAVVERVVRTVESLDMAPIVLAAEIEGFVFNRLQGALLREAYCLVRDGIVSPVDVDTLVREGLGQRWSIIGPFATNELNTRGGLRQHAQVHGKVYARLGIERSAEDPWTPETIDRVAVDIEASLPHDDWSDNVKERDRAMIAVASLLHSFVNPLSTIAVRSSRAELAAVNPLGP